MKRLVVGIVLLLCLSGGAVRANTDSLINTEAPPWEVRDWMNSKPLTLEELRGRVVVVRWWTGPGCPFCSTSAPALNEFYQKYHEKGLEVIGFYHHKGPSRLKKYKVSALSNDFGFRFPVAIDHQWKTLGQWWLNDGARKWTSVTFVIDKKGIIRYIHPGGSFQKGDEGYRQLIGIIEKLLSETVSRLGERSYEHV